MQSENEAPRPREPGATEIKSAYITRDGRTWWAHAWALLPQGRVFTIHTGPDADDAGRDLVTTVATLEARFAYGDPAIKGRGDQLVWSRRVEATDDIATEDAVTRQHELVLVEAEEILAEALAYCASLEPECRTA